MRHEIKIPFKDDLIIIFLIGKILNIKSLKLIKIDTLIVCITMMKN